MIALWLGTGIIAQATVEPPAVIDANPGGAGYGTPRPIIYLRQRKDAVEDIREAVQEAQEAVADEPDTKAAEAAQAALRSLVYLSAANATRSRITATLDAVGARLDALAIEAEHMAAIREATMRAIAAHEAWQAARDEEDALVLMLM